MLHKQKTSENSVEVLAPFDQTLISSVATADSNIVDKTIETAYQLYRDREKWLSKAKRIEILKHAILIMQEQADSLALEAAREGGKPLIDSEVEVARAIDGLQLCIDYLRTESGSTIPMGINPASENKLAVTTAEPIGVVVAISAFNHPINLIVHQVGPAIAAGCPVIIKPAKATPLSCFKFVNILYEAGLPREWCQALVTQNHEVTMQMVADKRVAFLSFIGNANVGWKLRSNLAAGTRCALEHGGVAPVVVAEDADLNLVAPKLLKAGFYHAGQVCVSVQRIFAHSSIAKTLAKQLADGAEKLIVGDPTDSKTEVGPLISTKEVTRVTQWVDEAIDEGAQLLVGGKATSATTYACTVLYNPSSKSKVSTKELFAPVICIYPFDNIDDAINQANALPYSFQAAVFSKNIDTATYLYKNLDASAVMVNDHTAFRVDWMPFAGLKESGLGVGGIPYTIKDMQVEKMLVLSSKNL